MPDLWLGGLPGVGVGRVSWVMLRGVSVVRVVGVSGVGVRGVTGVWVRLRLVGPWDVSGLLGWWLDGSGHAAGVGVWLVVDDWGRLDSCYLVVLKVG